MLNPVRNLPFLIAAVVWLAGPAGAGRMASPAADRDGDTLLIDLAGVREAVAADGAAAESALVHNIHVTYASLGVDQNYASARVKYFKHDLEKAIARAIRKDSVALGVDSISDSLYLGYVDTTFVLLQDGKPLEGRLTSSGEEGEMWWYEILYEAPRTIDRLTIVNTQLTEIFYDQKNILKAQNLETGKRKAFYYNGKVTKYDVDL